MEYIPQFHGREHIQVKRCMEAINSKSTKEQLSYNHKAIIYTFRSQDSEPYKKDYFKGFDCDNEEEEKEIEEIHRDGLRLFKEIFRMDSITYTAQGSVWGDTILSMLKSEGVELISGQQTHPIGGKGYKKLKRNVVQKTN